MSDYGNERYLRNDAIAYLGQVMKSLSTHGYSEENATKVINQIPSLLENILPATKVLCDFYKGQLGYNGLAKMVYNGVLDWLYQQTQRELEYKGIKEMHLYCNGDADSHNINRYYKDASDAEKNYGFYSPDIYKLVQYGGGVPVQYDVPRERVLFDFSLVYDLIGKNIWCSCFNENAVYIPNGEVLVLKEDIHLIKRCLGVGGSA